MTNRLLPIASAAVLALGIAASPSAIAQQSGPNTPQGSGTMQRSADHGMQHPGNMQSGSMSKDSDMQHDSMQSDSMKHGTMKNEAPKQGSKM